MCQIDINGVKITLTSQQLQQIKDQTDNTITLDNLDYSKACKLLGLQQRSKEDYWTNKNWAEYQLETIIKAANFLDNNNQEWNPDFLDQNIYRYIPWFNRTKVGWVFLSVSGYSCYSYCSVGLYYKKETTAKLIATKFIDLYNQYLG